MIFHLSHYGPAPNQSQVDQCRMGRTVSLSRKPQQSLPPLYGSSSKREELRVEKCRVLMEKMASDKATIMKPLNGGTWTKTPEIVGMAGPEVPESLTATLSRKLQCTGCTPSRVRRGQYHNYEACLSKQSFPISSGHARKITHRILI